VLDLPQEKQMRKLNIIIRRSADSISECACFETGEADAEAVKRSWVRAQIQIESALGLPQVKQMRKLYHYHMKERRFKSEFAWFATGGADTEAVPIS
jgi:hypothetical protein